MARCSPENDATSRQVFKEEHDKQTEVLLKQLRTDEKPVSPCEDVPQLKEEIKVSLDILSFIRMVPKVSDLI